jgi:hypothetical protein
MEAVEVQIRDDWGKENEIERPRREAAVLSDRRRDAVVAHRGRCVVDLQRWEGEQEELREQWVEKAPLRMRREG